MILMILVSFADASNPALARISYKVPQFFNQKGQPYQLENMYLLSSARRLREKSTLTVAEHTKEFLAWRKNNNRYIEDITDADFEYYIDALCGHRNKFGQGLSWNTVNSRISGAHRFLIWCRIRGINQQITLEYAPKSIGRAYPSYSTKKHPSRRLIEPTKFLLMDDAMTFIRAIGERSANFGRIRERNLLIAKLMLQCGLRVSEAVNFPASDLPTINHTGQSTPARILGKGGKARVILIPNGLLSDLWSYMDISRESILEHMATKDEESSMWTLFLTEYGKALTANWIEKIFVKVGSDIGLRVVPHTLRHTFGSYHYLYNRDLLFLSKLMGHESMSTTERFYVHIAKLISYTGNYEELQRTLDATCREI